MKWMLLLLAFLVCAAQADPTTRPYSVARVQDPDGWAYARSAPSTGSEVKRKLTNGTLVFVSDWPAPVTMKQLRATRSTAEALSRIGIELESLPEWRWVIIPEVREDQSAASAGGTWAYVHSSRLQTVRRDAVSWGRSLDPDGYQNLRSSPAGSVIGRVGQKDCFILLTGDQEYSPPMRPSNAEWVPVMTTDGTVGYLKNDHLLFFDWRDWQWSGDIPFVDIPYR